MTERESTLVLGGGGLRGLAHIGVIEVLEDHQISPREVVGSSIGSLVAAAWCAGMSVGEMKEIALALQRRDIFRVAHRDMALRRMASPALYRREPLENFIRGILGGLTFKDLERPLIVNTVDLNSGTQVFWGAEGLDNASVADAVFASCALPGFIPPQEIEGRFYMDGAAVANLPVGIGAARGRDLVLAVDVGSTGIVRSEVHNSGFAAIYARAQEIAIQTMSEIRLKDWRTPPMILLQPKIGHIPMFSFGHIERFIEEGHAAAAEVFEGPAELPGPGASGIFPRRKVMVRVDHDRCIGCGACMVHGPRGLFELDDTGKAIVTDPEQDWSPCDGAYVRQCPTYAIFARPVNA